MEDIKINIQKVENLVIGAGVFGLSASNYLLDKGQEVCLIDKSSNFDEASSNALGRIDPILGGAGHGNETKPLDVAKISLGAYKKFIELDNKFKNNIDFEVKPTLHFYENDSEYKKIKKVIDLIDPKEKYFSIDLYENKTNEISLSKNKFAKFDGTIFIDSKKYQNNLFDNFIKSGGDFIKNEITEINTLGNNLEVISDKEKYITKRIIIAAGPWTNAIKGINIKQKIFPSKGQILKLSDPENTFTDFHLHGPCSVVKKKDGLIWIAATVEDKDFDKSKTDYAKNYLFEKSSQIVSNIKDYNFHSQTACLRPSNENDLPFIEKVADKEIYLASGGGGWGIMMSILVGEILYKIIRD